MSSEYTTNWPIETSLSEHMRWTDSVQGEIARNMQMPEDDRIVIGIGLIAIGGQHAAVIAKGMPGSGKTHFGNLMLGSMSRVDIENTDTEDTLFGYPNPINKSERIEGKFKLDGENPIVYANEISHMGNTGPLHRLWDAETVEVNGVLVPMSNAAIYATSNFPNNQRVHELDEAINSRFAVELLFGDASSDFARSLHGRDIGVTAATATQDPEGVIPNAKARLDLRRNVLEAYPLDGREFGGYVSDVVDSINGRRDLFNSISNTDNRLSLGWQQAIRAKLLMERAGPVRVGAEEASKVAALVLPTMVTLSQAAKAELKTILGVPKIDPLTEAIARRRLLSTMAYGVVEQTKAFPTDESQSYRDRFRDKYSYASANGDMDKIDEFVEKALEGKTEHEQPQSTAKPRRFFGRS